MSLYGHCDTCGAPCNSEGCVIEIGHIPALDVDDPTRRLALPGVNESGELPHAYPLNVLEYSTCTACGADVFYDDTDDEGTGIWTHTETLDYFCEPA